MVLENDTMFSCVLWHRKPTELSTPSIESQDTNAMAIIEEVYKAVVVGGVLLESACLFEQLAQA